MKGLIVEDELIVGLDLENHLTKKQIEVRGIFTNFDEAIEAVNQTKPDIVFLDINIQGNKNGIDLAKAIKKTNGNIHLVFITAFSNEKIMEEINQLEASGYLRKPFKEEELEAIINKCKNT